MNKLLKNTLNLLPKINLREKVHFFIHLNFKHYEKNHVRSDGYDRHWFHIVW